jgi:predicted nucleic acid-binding Zn ribbon protein
VAAGAGEPAEIGSVLDGLLGGSPWRAGLTLGELARRWEEVVGERLATETAPARLDDRGVLIVRATSSAWAAQLRFLSGEVARNANQVLGNPVVTDVRIVLDREG